MSRRGCTRPEWAVGAASRWRWMPGWVAEFREGRCVHLGLRPSFEEAHAVAREREGVEADG
jgi:hypothetical protein